MMRLLSLIPVFMMVVGASGSVGAQYDFYEFMNPAGNTPTAQTAAPRSVGTLPAPRIAQNGIGQGTSGDVVRNGQSDVTLGGVEMMEMPPLAGQSVLDMPPAAPRPSLVEEAYALSREPSTMSQQPYALSQEPYAVGSAYTSSRSGHFGAVDPLAPTGCGYCAAGCGQCGVAGHAAAAPMPYRQPVLPPPATLYGYFNSPPCYAHLWDTYPQEAAVHCARLHQATRPHHSKRSVRGELVEPCR
jgi:hypothetical protein